MNCPHCNSENVGTYYEDPDMWRCLDCGWIFPKSKGVEEKKEEPYPVHEALKVIKGKTLFKNQKWWEAVLLVETNFGGKTYHKVTWYRWSWGTVKPRDGQPYQKWIRKEHKNINFVKNWNDAKIIIEEFMKEV